MRIAIGSDHAGYNLKEKIKVLLAERGIEVIDSGTSSGDVSVDYSDYAYKTTNEILSQNADRAILVCGTGIGMSIAANKTEGIRAALCHDDFTAEMCRKHNNANVLVLGARVLESETAKKIVEIWLDTEFDGGRHQDRLNKITAYEKDKSYTYAKGRTVVMDHPLIKHKVALLRNKDTSSKDFRDLVQEIAGLMVYEVTRNLPLKEIEIETPIKKTKAYTLAGKKLAIVPVLRAGLGMVDGILRIIPSAKVGHIGLFRDPKTYEPVEYYCKLPNDIQERDIFVVDPMLATGGSAAAAVTKIQERGGKRISLVCLISAPEGIAKFHEEHPDVDIYTASLDEGLNDHCYIVPGLGDAGDRLFGTK